MVDEVLKSKLNQFHQALNALAEIDFTSQDRIVKDAAIQRFEYTVEIFWKTLKTYLFVQESLDVYSPKQVIRESRNVGLLSEEQTIQAIEMIEHRNLSSHLYNLEMADEIFNHIPKYIDLMKIIIQKIEDTLKNN